MKQYLRFRIDAEHGFWENFEKNGTKLDIQIESYLGDFDSRNNISDNFKHMITTYDITPGDTFYFAPGVIIPRVKLKDMYSQNNIKNVRTIDVASKVFIGRKTLNTLTDHCWYHHCDTNSFKEFLDAAMNCKSIDPYYYDKCITALEFYTSDKVIFDYNTRRVLANCTIYNFQTGALSGSSDNFGRVLDEHIDLVNYMMNNTIYDERALIPHINGPDAVSINEEMFQTICTMFNSSDRDNWTVAMEIMANSDYDEGLMYLLLLMYEHGGRMEEVPSKNHVNFKTLANFLGLKTSYLSITRDRIVDILIDKEGITKERMDYMLNYFQDTVSNDRSKYFQVKSVTYTDVITKMIDEELIVKTKEDYIHESRNEIISID
jgi:hypothetical protein